MIETNDVEAKRQMARDILENKFFQFVFSMSLKSIEEKIDDLNPNDGDGFSIHQSQKYLIKDLYNSFVIAASEESIENENTSGIL